MEFFQSQSSDETDLTNCFKSDQKDVSNLTFIHKPSFILIRSKKKPLQIRTSICSLPFGVEKEYGNYLMKICIGGYRQHIPVSRKFLDKIIAYEKQFCQYLNIDPNMFMSQIRWSEKYDPLLTTRFFGTKSNPLVIKDPTGKSYTFVEIPTKCKLKGLLEASPIWKTSNQKHVVKWIWKSVVIKELPPENITYVSKPYPMRV